MDSLYDGACMLLTAGRIGSLSVCILMRALSVGAAGFICNIYLLVLVYYDVAFFVMFVEFVFGIICKYLFGVGLYDYRV